MRAHRLPLSAAAALATALTSLPASALPLCGANGQPVVYMAGTAKPYVAAVAKALFSDSAPITIVFVSVTSCLGLDAVLSPGTSPISGTASYFDAASPNPGNEEKCTIDVPDGGTVTVDIGASDVFANTCTGATGGLPKDVGDFFGPVASMTFVVPKASTEKAISATAAYYVYGLGAGGHVAPWTDENWILKRNEASGTGLLIGTGIGLESRKWRGFDPGFSGAMITKLSVGAPANAIGILSATEFSDSVSTMVTQLAYKHFGQSCAYYPDSSLGSKDKLNTRDGHYMLWGPYHFFTKIDPTTGNVRSANAQRVINYLTGATRPPGSLDLIQVSALNNLVPTCAMKVKRASEVGPLSSFAPPNACGCYFEKVATGKTSCKTCMGNSDCPGASPVCSYGYCEAQ